MRNEPVDLARVGDERPRAMDDERHEAPAISAASANPMSETWTNWAGEQRCAPSAIERP